MKSTHHLISSASALLIAAGLSVACGGSQKEADTPDALDEDGPMEEAGEATDDAMEEAGDAMDDAAEETEEAFDGESDSD